MSRGASTMIIQPKDLQPDPLSIDETIEQDAISYSPDVRQIGPMRVEGRAELIEEHGDGEVIHDIRVRGHYWGRLELLCSRCADPAEEATTGEFDLIFRPSGTDAVTGERALTEAETEIGYYEESGLVLEDVVREQVLLSLPERLVCMPDPNGLCLHCGQNLSVPLRYSDSMNDVDPRWEALAGLAERLKSDTKQ